MRCRRGRQRSPRWIESVPEVTYYKPAGVPMRYMEVIEVSFAELEALRLVDLEGLTQEEAAVRMGISRRSFWNDLESARKKVIHALVNGCALELVGLDYRVGQSEVKEKEGNNNAKERRKRTKE